MLQAKNDTNWQFSFQKEVENVKNFITHDGRWPIAIGHLSDSGDLKPGSDNKADTDAAIKG